MAIFQDTSNAKRDLRILPSRALPLPRLSPKPNNPSSTEENREVVVIGVSKCHHSKQVNFTHGSILGWTEWPFPYLVAGQIWHHGYFTALPRCQAWDAKGWSSRRAAASYIGSFPESRHSCRNHRRGLSYGGGCVLEPSVSRLAKKRQRQRH